MATAVTSNPETDVMYSWYKLYFFKSEKERERELKSLIERRLEGGGGGERD